ncbi:MAG: hypothetical protein EBR23_11700, partial [Planctomycetia bacterium]|nr:hypothetical protein [Planctomycetia bacterium]
MTKLFSQPRRPRVRSRRASPASRLAPTQRGFEVLEARHALTFADLLPTLADVRQSAYQTEDQSLFFTNQQKAAATGVNVGGEVTLYSLRPAFAANYAIDVRAARGSGIDPAIALYDEAGIQVAVNDDVSPEDSSSRLVVSLLAGQHYCLAVTSYDNAVTGGYAVDVVAQIGDDSHENNNTLRQATATPLAAAVQGVMADDRDLYAVVLKGVGRLGSSASIDFDNALGDLDLTLANASVFHSPCGRMRASATTMTTCDSFSAPWPSVSQPTRRTNERCGVLSVVVTGTHPFRRGCQRRPSIKSRDRPLLLIIERECGKGRQVPPHVPRKEPSGPLGRHAVQPLQEVLE